MFKSIAQVVSESIEPLLSGIEVDAGVAADQGLTWLADNDRDYLAHEALARKITDAAKKMSKKAEEAIGSATMGLFGDLPVAVPVCVDGRRIKAIMALTQEEAAWVISMREKQVAADTKSVRRFKQLYMRALPFWENDGSLTWADCLRAASVSPATTKVAA